MSKVLCPFVECGKPFPSISNVNTHLRHKHKCGLQLSENTPDKENDETASKRQSKSPSKKKRKMEKVSKEITTTPVSSKREESVIAKQAEDDNGMIFLNLGEDPLAECRVRKGIYKCSICPSRETNLYLFGLHTFQQHPNTELARTVESCKIRSACIVLKDCSNLPQIHSVDAALLPPTLCEIEESLTEPGSKSSIKSPGKRKTFPCHICGRNFTFRENRHRHLKNNSCYCNSGSKRGLGNSSQQSAKVQCHICGRNFSFRSNRRRHIRNNSCNKQTGWKKKSLSRQIEITPEGEPMKKSAELEKETFLEKKSIPGLNGEPKTRKSELPLQEVEIQIDDLEEVFPSIECPEEPQLTQLQQPEEVNHSVRQEKTPSESEWEINMDDVRPFTRFVEYEMADNPSLENGKAVSTAQNALHYHLSPYRDQLSAVEKKRKRNTETIIDKQLSSFCPICGKAFSSILKLNKHIREHESQERKEPITCPICKKYLAPEMNLRLHIVWHRSFEEAEYHLN